MLRKANNLHVNPHGGTATFGMADLTAHLGLWPGAHSITDGDGAGSGTGSGGGSGEQSRYTAAEWSTRRKAELADKNQDELIAKVVTLEMDNRDLRGNQVPKGARVLTADEQKAWDAYTALGTPDEVTKAVTDGRAAITERDELRDAQLVQTAAKAAGADETVLADRLKVSGLRTETRDIDRDGTKVQQVHVVDATGKDLGELRAYADTNWKPYAPALFPAASAGVTQPVQTGITITPQAGAGATTAPLAQSIEARIASRAAAANPTAGGQQ